MRDGFCFIFVLNPPKNNIPTDDATSVVAATLLVMVVSAGKKADQQRAGMLSSLREISMLGSIIWKKTY